jgi:hypothetical protein
MSILKILLSELKEISEESRKNTKFNSIKELSDKAILNVKNIQEKKKNSTNEEISLSIKSNEDIIKPFIKAIDSKSPKLILISLSALQKLILFEGITIIGINIVVDGIVTINEQESLDEVTQLKMLQLCSTILTTPNFDMSQTILAKVNVSHLYLDFKYVFFLCRFQKR